MKSLTANSAKSEKPAVVGTEATKAPAKDI
jgi:hypothetical protein